MKINVRAASQADINSVTRIYEDLCDYLEKHHNYPGWKKGIYPTQEDAVQGLGEQSLYVAWIENRIVGSFFLRNVGEEGYQQANWLTENDYSRILVVYTLAVDPVYFHAGVGKALLDFAEQKAKEDGCHSIRLDVVKGNIPAENLYIKCGFQYIDTVSLGYEAYGLPWYDLYEKVIVQEENSMEPANKTEG